MSTATRARMNLSDALGVSEVTPEIMSGMTGWMCRGGNQGSVK
jgi:hypothetical protein